jgi:dGTPase
VSPNRRGNLADEVAYNNHDVDDGLRSGLLSLAELGAIPIVARHLRAVKRERDTQPIFF